MNVIKTVDSISEKQECFKVMSQLWSSLTEKEFIEKNQSLAEDYNYKLAFLKKENEIKTVAGFRIIEDFAFGKVLYIDDLVSNQSNRSQGYGRAMFDWLSNYARENNCCAIHLNARVDRTKAHKFYFSCGMHIRGYHFSMDL